MRCCGLPMPLSPVSMVSSLVRLRTSLYTLTMPASGGQVESRSYSHSLHDLPHRGLVLLRYRATRGAVRSMSSGRTMCVSMSTVRMNLHGEPQRNRLRASLSVATRCAIVSRSVMSLCRYVPSMPIILQPCRILVKSPVGHP